MTMKIRINFIIKTQINVKPTTEILDMATMGMGITTITTTIIIMAMVEALVGV